MLWLTVSFAFASIKMCLDNCWAPLPAGVIITSVLPWPVFKMSPRFANWLCTLVSILVAVSVASPVEASKRHAISSTHAKGSMMRSSGEWSDFSKFLIPLHWMTGDSSSLQKNL